MKKTYIGNIAIDQTAVLAPMASVTDRAYRQLAVSFGAQMTTSEMVSAKGLLYQNKKTEKLLTVTEEERPMGIQLFGSDPADMARAVEIVMRHRPDFIDINMGCPVPKVYQNGCGAALLQKPEQAEEIVSRMVRVSPVPVTVKMRKAPGEDTATIEFARRMENAGAAAVTIHGRTRAQMYRSYADWQIIKKVKEALVIPVIGNGDVTTPQEAKALYEQTGADLVMIGRGSYGRPWLFSQIDSYLKTGTFLPDPPLEQKLTILQTHIERICRYEGEEIGMRKARAQAMRYMKGFPGAAKWRSACAHLTRLEDLYSLIHAIAQAENNE